MRKTITGKSRPLNYIISAVAHGIKELNPLPRLTEQNARFLKTMVPEYENCFVENIYDEEDLARHFPFVFQLTKEFIKEFEVEINLYLFKIKTGYRVKDGIIVGEEREKNPMVEAFYTNKWWDRKKTKKKSRRKRV